MSTTDYGDNTLNVTGGGNQFVVVYKFSGTDDPNAASSGPPADAPFGAAGSLNNTDPNFDFSTLDQGQVIMVDGGNADTTVEGGNKQFVVQYNLPGSPDPSANLGGNAVKVDGGNNKFVVAYEYPAGDAQTGNSVSVEGGSNQYVVDYKYMLPAGSDAPAAGDGQPVEFADSSGSDPNGNSGVTAGNPGGNSVTVNGDNNQYAVQYGDPSGATTDAASASPFGAAGGNPFAGNIPSGASMGGSASGGMDAGSSGMSDDQLTDMIKQSPFGVLLGLPGVNSAADIFGNVGGGGSSPMSGGAGGNPFAGSASGSDPMAGGAPASTDEMAAGGAAAGPASADAGGGSPMSGGAAGGNPFAGSASGSNPFASFAPQNTDGMAAGGTMAGPAPADAGNPDYSYDFANTDASGGAGSESGGAPQSDDGSSGGNSGGMMFDSSMLASSPFGALLQIPGFTTDDIANIFAGSNNGGGNPFAIAGNTSGSPFDLGAAITGMVDTLAAAPPSEGTTNALTAVQSMASTVANDASMPGSVTSFASNIDTQVTQILANQGS